MKYLSDLRQIRKSRKMTLVQLTQKTGISPSQLSNFEIKETLPTISTLYKLAFALHLTFKEMFNKELSDKLELNKKEFEDNSKK